VGILGLDPSLAKDTESAKAMQIMANLPEEITRRIMTVDLPWREQMKTHFGDLPEDSGYPRDPTNTYNQIFRLCKEYILLIFRTIWRARFLPDITLADCIIEAKYTILRPLHAILHKPNCPPEVYHELAMYITKRLDALYLQKNPADPLYSQSICKMVEDNLGIHIDWLNINNLEWLKPRILNNVFNLFRFYKYLSSPKPTEPGIAIPIVNLYNKTHIVKSVPMDRLLNIDLLIDHEMYEEIARDGITPFWCFAEMISGWHNTSPDRDVNYDILVEASTTNVLSVEQKSPTYTLYDRDIPADVEVHRGLLIEVADVYWRTNQEDRLIDERKQPIMDENNQPLMDEEGNPKYPLSIALWNERLDFFALQDAAENENI
jgi:hypothetical protein